MLSKVTVKDNILADEKYKYIFSVDAVNELVQSGMSFREAYQKIGNDIQNGNFVRPKDFEASKYQSHEGSIGNLCNDKIVIEMTRVLHKFN